MKLYANLNGDSGVRAFATDDRSIVVEFVGGAQGAERFYRYSHASAGIARVRAMKLRAEAGRGLSTYIAQHAPKYESKW
jgi:hypothetical protein